MARSEDWSCPLRLPTPAAAHVAIASGVSQRVTSLLACLDRFAAGHPEVIRRHRYVRKADEVGQTGRNSMSCPVDKQNAPRTASPVFVQGAPP